MFQLLPCSRCQRTFSIRSEVSDQALLKCPSCGNQFRLGDLLDAYYGPWEILENPGVASAGEVAAGVPIAVVPPSTPAAAPRLTGSASEHAGIALGAAGQDTSGGLSLDGPDLELAEDADEASAGVSLDGAASDKPKADWSNFKPITHEEFQRMKRADRSPIWSTLQVVLGGVAAIPVSLLLIWHVLGKDVAGAGPAVARYVPWIVPEKFRGQPPADLVDAADAQRIPRRGDSGFRNFDDVMPPTDQGSRDASSGDGLEGAVGDAAVLATLDQESDATGADDDESAAADTASSGEFATEGSSGTTDQPTADVFALLQRTKQKVDDWKDVAAAPGSVKRDAAIALFDDLASLGVRLSAIPDTQGAPALVRDKAQEISRAIKRQPDLTEVLHNAAKAQLNGNLPRSKEGWVLVCTVGEMLDQGDSWRIMVADSTLLPLDVPKIEIPKSVARQLTTGQRLLLLGKFVTSAPADLPPEDSAAPENSEAPAPALETFRASFSYGL